MCVLCACCFRETKAFCQSVFMIFFVFVHDSVHEYHTTFIQRRDVQCVFVRNSIRQLSYRDMCVCVAQCPLCVEQPQPRQTMPHWVPPSPPASGEDTKMMSLCLSITNFLSKLTTAICENDVWLRLGRLLFRSAQEVA